MFSNIIIIILLQLRLCGLALLILQLLLCISAEIGIIKNKSLKFQYITKFLLTLLDIVVVLYFSNAVTFTITEAVTIATACGFGTDTLTAGWIQVSCIPFEDTHTSMSSH